MDPNRIIELHHAVIDSIRHLAYLESKYGVDHEKCVDQRRELLEVEKAFFDYVNAFAKAMKV